MSAYTEFFLNSQSSIAQLDCLEISHSLFTQTYYIVRNASLGVTVTHEDSTVHDYMYRPVRVSQAGSRADLNNFIKIELGDLGEILPTEIDAIGAGNGFSEFPAVIYRTYRSDDLETVLYGPIRLEIRSFSFNREGAAFEAKAPSIRVDKTGELYKPARFPMLRALL